MVQVVGGDRIALTTIVGPDADTHVYEPKPADAQVVGKAKVFFVSGLGFEGWMDRLVQSTGYRGALVVASNDVKSRSMDEDGTIITDPHAWQNLANGLIYVDNIEKGLCAADAAGCDTYMANAKAYKTEISALDTEVRAKIAAIPDDKRKVITTHDAFGYFGAA
jgi:zinc/manganese transport system substrate-binding protein